MKKLLLSVTFLSFFSACSNYQKILKSTDLNLKFTKAVEYYKTDDFNRALPLFEELSTTFKGSEKAEEVNYYYAYCRYSLGEYLMASYLFQLYSQTFPKGMHTEECQYMNAYCYYKESPIFTLDGKNTHKAIDQLQLFVNIYPQSERVKQCNDLIDELRDRLAKKAFYNAKQYHKTEYYKSAIIALQNVLIDFPGNPFEEEIQFLLIESSYFLAKNSIFGKKASRLKEAIKYYNEAIEKYPNSKFIKGVKNTYQEIKKLIEIINQS